MTPVFFKFTAALITACWSLSTFAESDITLLRVNGQRDPAELQCPTAKPQVRAQTGAQASPSRSGNAASVSATSPDTAAELMTASQFEMVNPTVHKHTPGLKIGLWGDSHTASGTFADSLLEALRLPQAQTHPSFIAPTFGLKGIRQPLRRTCLSDDWHLNLAYRNPTESPQAYAKSLAHLGTEDTGAFIWLDFRHPDAQTRVKWADIHFAKDKVERSLVLGITVDEGAEAIVNLGPSSSQRLRVQAEHAFATLRLRVIAGQIRIDGIAPVYDGNTQAILDVFSIPGATAKGWRVVDSGHLRREDPLNAGYDVVILQSGTNESLDPDFKVGLYEAQLNASLTRLKNAYPKARCILIGPPDAQRSSNTLRLINDSQYRLANAKGCTHWHWQKAMGGPGATQRWLAKGWMQNDLLHQTPDGYAQSARSFVSMVPIKVR